MSQLILVILINSKVWIYLTISVKYFSMIPQEEGFNITQGMSLLLMKPLNMPANLVLKLIIFITDPKNKIGY